MPLTKQQKIEIMEEYKKLIAGARAIVFSDYSGVEVVDMQDLRKKLKKSEINFKVAKNTLLKKALVEAGIEIDEAFYSKPLAVSFDEQDEVASSKIISEKAKIVEKLEILGGIINGVFVDAQKIQALAQMPSREELYAKVVGSIAAPISGLVNVMSGNLRGLVSVLNQYKNKIS